jgi:pimeloyl-ACP methyl ester carboxylesterase
MPAFTSPRLLVTALAIGALLPVGMVVPAQAASTASVVASKPPPSDRTSAQEARRVDRVPTPKLRWYPCYGNAECATTRLPLDYDKPHGATTLVAVLRVKAKDQKHRIGSLFVNPGGPGGSGTAMAQAAPYFLSADVLDRFDVVGIDPRGTNFSDQVACFPGNAQQGKVLSGLNVAFPFTKAQEQAAVASSRGLGKACSTTGRPLSAAMSTAEVARDMDVIRRGVGDKRLSYLGFSYGSYLGQVYANLFPDRVRALAIDAVLDPVAWAGTKATASRPQSDRIRSADGATKALHQILVLCDKAGGQKCRFSPGNPVVNYDVVANRLKARPLVFTDPYTGELVTFTYADLVSGTLGSLYGPYGYLEITGNLADLIILTEPPAKASSAAGRARRVAAVRSFARNLAAQKKRDAGRTGWSFPYDNGFEAFEDVACTDSLNPADAAAWPALAAAADRRAKYFGRLWIWESSPCAGRTWTARDEDGYRGPFTRRTIAPVLVVGTRWDPATNYDGAVSAARLLPNSRLLSNDNWGHTSYGSSQCVTGAMDTYLLTQKVPARGAFCHGDVQPFVGTPPGEAGLARPDLRLPPVAPPFTVASRH